MANNRLTFEGMEDFRAALRQLPARLVGTATTIVERRAQTASNQIAVSYPFGTEQGGHLKDGMQVKVQPSRFGVIATVSNTSKYAKPFEYGTQVRRTDKGWSRGAAPPGNVFYPVITRQRADMVEDLIRLLQQEGLAVGR